MDASPAQVRALDALAGLRLSDPPSLDMLTRLYPHAKTVDVQRAIAGILIRSDYHALVIPEITRTLRQYRLKSPAGPDLCHGDLGDELSSACLPATSRG